MNDYGRRYLIEHIRGRDHMRNSNRDMENDLEDDFEDDFEDERDYYDELDSRRGVKGSGRGRRRGRRRDMRDMEDFHHKMELKLTKSELNKWKHSMQNTDGTQGEHFDMQQVMHAAEKLGVKFRDYDEREFCVAVNMFYSDYGHIIKRLVQDKDKELLVCADFAKA